MPANLLEINQLLQSLLKLLTPKPVTPPIKVIHHTAKILGLVGAVSTALGTIFGWSAQTITLLTMAASSALASWEHRDELTRRIKWWWFPAAVICISLGLWQARFCIYHGFIKDPSLQVLGLVRAHSHPNSAMTEIQAGIRNAKQSLWFGGANFYVSLPAYKEDLKAALKRGVDVKFLVVSPDTKELEKLAAMFDQSAADLQAECRKSMGVLHDLMKYQVDAKTAGKLEICTFECAPRTRLYIFDGQDLGGKTIFVPHVYLMDSTALPAYVAAHVPGGVASTYHQSWDRLWGASQPVSLSMLEQMRAMEMATTAHEKMARIKLVVEQPYKRSQCRLLSFLLTTVVLRGLKAAAAKGQLRALTTQ